MIQKQKQQRPSLNTSGDTSYNSWTPGPSRDLIVDFYIFGGQETPYEYYCASATTAQTNSVGYMQRRCVQLHAMMHWLLTRLYLLDVCVYLVMEAEIMMLSHLLLLRLSEVSSLTILSTSRLFTFSAFSTRTTVCWHQLSWGYRQDICHQQLVLLNFHFLSFYKEQVGGFWCCTLWKWGLDTWPWVFECEAVVWLWPQRGLQCLFSCLVAPQPHSPSSLISAVGSNLI